MSIQASEINVQLPSNTKENGIQLLNRAVQLWSGWRGGGTHCVGSLGPATALPPGAEAGRRCWKKVDKPRCHNGSSFQSDMRSGTQVGDQGHKQIPHGLHAACRSPIGQLCSRRKLICLCLVNSSEWQLEDRREHLNFNAQIFRGHWHCFVNGLV